MYNPMAQTNYNAENHQEKQQLAAKMPVYVQYINRNNQQVVTQDNAAVSKTAPQELMALVMTLI
ncbi:MAG TPA: hypothetical protein VH186_19315 [Chloroflexia bacterium]|nr:hypothetical protein [Chloroflexia bacterium]